MAEHKYSDEIIDELLERLEAGKSLSEICRDPRMPNRRTVYRWQRAGDELSERIIDALDVGYDEFAEETLRLVAECECPHKARNLLASRQWYLGKRSRAYADRPVLGLAVNVDSGESFAAIAGALESIAAAKSSGRTGTRTLAIDSPTGPADSD